MNIKLCREKLETLDSFKIKIIACFCMTVDHVGAFGSDILGSWYYTIFRMIGRIAAPLFLFILVQSIRHTRNRTNFLKRLYLAGAVIGYRIQYLTSLVQIYLEYMISGTHCSHFFMWDSMLPS